eukprot:10337857-Alexandrium_andersonii.AAC.1
MVLGKLLPMALYGCPATPVPSKGMSALRAAIVRVLAPKAASARSTGVALCAVTKKCVDPLVHVLVARIVAMRRACVLEPTT